MLAAKLGGFTISQEVFLWGTASFEELLQSWCPVMKEQLQVCCSSLVGAQVKKQKRPGKFFAATESLRKMLKGKIKAQPFHLLKAQPLFLVYFSCSDFVLQTLSCEALTKAELLVCQWWYPVVTEYKPGCLCALSLCLSNIFKYNSLCLLACFLIGRVTEHFVFSYLQ